ncbi:MAG: MipA/OmpV family protein [Pseudomonadota bacterium]
MPATFGHSQLAQILGGCALSAILAIPTETQAQGSFIGVGVGTGPDYDGSNDYDTIPLVFGQFDLGGSTLQLRGLGARIELPLSQRVTGGPVFRYRFGRDDDVSDVRVARLPNIDDAIELGGFLRFQTPLGASQSTLGFAEVELLADVSDAHDGVIANLDFGISTRPSPRLGLSLSTNITFVNDNYADTNYSISAAGSAASGLGVFNADGGLHAVGLSLRANYQLTDQWGLVGIVSVQELLNDASDSPVVSVAGSSTQAVAGFGLTYSF